MKTLSETWFVDGNIDFELKKYKLLAYLQEINLFFHEHKLYPQLSDIIFHYNNLREFKENKQLLQQLFPKQLSQVNMEQIRLIYEKIVADDELMQELENIILYALQKMNHTIRQGTEIYEFVADKLSIFPIGIIPLDCLEGYMFLSDGYCQDTKVYQYQISIFERHDEKYRGIHTSYVVTYQRNFVNTYESIKSELLRQRKILPNPAVYSIETDLSFPLEETLLPVAKRSLVKYIAKNAA